MLPPAVSGRITQFARLRQTGSITLHFHQGTLSRIDYAFTQRPDADCTCDLVEAEVPCAACAPGDRALPRLRMAERVPH